MTNKISVSWPYRKLSAIVLAAAALFLLFHERHISSFDPANFVLMLRHGYSVFDDRPQTPGYPGFYILWKCIMWLTGLPPLTVLLCSTVGFGMLGIILTFVAGKQLFGERIAWLATILVITNPLFLFYTRTYEIYAYDTAFSAFLIILLLGRVGKFETPLYFLYGLLGAFRLSSVVLTLPIVLTVLVVRYFRHNDKRSLANMLAIILASLCWAIPYFLFIGGLSETVDLIRELARKTETFVENLATFLPFTLWTAGVLFLILALQWRALWALVRKHEERIFVLIGLFVAPAAFFCFKHYTKGYGLIYIVPLVLLAARAMTASAKWRSLFASAVAVNLLIFFALPCIPPSARSLLGKAHRTKSERLQTALLRSVSFFAPALSSSRDMDRAVDTEDTMLSTLPVSSSVIVETSGISPEARVLQVEFPSDFFLSTHGGNVRLLRWFHGASDGDDFNLLARPKDEALYYLTTVELCRETGPPPACLIESRGNFELYAVYSSERDEMLRFLMAYF
ncbi:MAG TPA: hypothetical protein VFH95_05130 [Candidatus Kapabacteria bacterium]|nr:hypothetical protein [Candidatus Kapabacteria bacterium]